MGSIITFTKYSYPQIGRCCSSGLLNSVLSICTIEFSNEFERARWNIDYSDFERKENTNNLLKVIIAFSEYCNGELYVNERLSSLAEILIDLENLMLIDSYKRSIILQTVTSHAINNTTPYFIEDEDFIVPEISDCVEKIATPKYVPAYFSPNVSCVFYYDERIRDYKRGEYYPTFDEARQRAKELNKENAPE